MENLPLEITRNILCVFLPVDSQLQCRAVCKTWLSLLPKPKMNIGLLHGVSRQVVAEFYFSEHNHVDELGTLTRKFEHCLSLTSSTHENFIVGSCNGLVCYAGDHISITGERRIYIFNPITGEQTQTPANKWGGYSNSEWGIGFGYNRSNNKYKVVRILHECNPYRKGTIQVYTLQGGAVWRTKTSIIEKPPLYRSGKLPVVGVFVGGSLHWISHQTDDRLHYIIAFDLEKETFEHLPSIPSVDHHDANYVKLIELGGTLCVLELVPSKHVTIWEYTQENVSCWVTKFSIAWEDHSWLNPLTVIKREEYGKCLLWYNALLYCYDSETKSLRKLDETLGKFINEWPSIHTITQVTPVGILCW